MAKVKILHCADIHLGTDFQGLGKISAIRRNDMQKSFANIISICKSENIQLLLIAGDLFETVHISEELLIFVRDLFADIPDTKIAIASGNHDPLTADSPLKLKDFWPDNVIIFKDSMQTIELADLGVCLWGAGFASAYVEASLLAGIHATKPEFINICVLHGAISSSNNSSVYNPITEKQIAESNMNYIALGHLHTCTEIKTVNKTAYAYSGCPEGRGFDELGKKGIYIGEISPTNCELKFREICIRQYAEVRVDISQSKNSKDMAISIIEKIKNTYGENFADYLYKVILTGELSEKINVQHDNILAQLSELFYVKLRDKTEILIDFEEFSKDTTLKGVFIRRMTELIQMQGSSETNKNALKLGLKAFSGKVNYHED